MNEIVFTKDFHMLSCSTNSKSFSDIISEEAENPIHKSKGYEDNACCLKIVRLLKITLKYSINWYVRLLLSIWYKKNSDESSRVSPNALPVELEKK